MLLLDQRARSKPVAPWWLIYHIFIKWPIGQWLRRSRRLLSKETVCRRERHGTLLASVSILNRSVDFSLGRTLFDVGALIAVRFPFAHPELDFGDAVVIKIKFQRNQGEALFHHFCFEFEQLRAMQKEFAVAFGLGVFPVTHLIRRDIEVV